MAALKNENGEAAEAVKRKVDELNNRPFKTKQHQGSRRSSFLEEEKAFMKPLPLKPYEAVNLDSERKGWIRLACFRRCKQLLCSF